MEALKALSIKLINTATFVYQLYRIQINSTGDTTVSINSNDHLQVCAELRNDGSTTKVLKMLFLYSA